ncbi:MAG TPA: DedA family protein [Blastocatellia bacterium]|nr:DedA family protein [Blastocatellia bacterium]
MLSALLSYFAHYGYWVVFFGVMLENAGVPVPGETILLAAGFFAAQGHFHLWEVMTIAALGAVLGDNAGYWIGHRLGRTTLERYGRYVGLTHARVLHMDRFFKAHGNKTILVARFITGLRVFAALLAGAARMTWKTFAIYNMLGAVLWSVAISLAGFFFGRSWDLLERWIRGAGLIALGIVVIIAITIWLNRRRRQKLEELEAETEA